MKASDLLVRSLEREGVEYVFGLPGEELEDLLFSLRDSEITFVPVRHEQGAAFMADVWGRLTGDAGVCLSTLGPGATNLVTGIADANLDKAPLVAITGQGGLERLHKESHQAIDVVDMLSPITDWNTQISDPDIVHESVRKAFKLAEYEKPGATHLEFPEDVAAEETGKTPLPEREPVRRPDPDVPSIERLEDLLESAERPLIITGNGAVRTDAAGPLRAFVEKTDYPVASTYMGKGAVSDADPHSLMTLDSGDHQEASTAISTADLIITVGYDIAEHDPADWNPKADATIVHVDSEPAEVYEHYDPDLEIVADIPATLRAITARLDDVEASCDRDWYSDLRDHIVEDVHPDPDVEDPVTIEGVLPILRSAMDETDVLVSDVGRHKMAIAQNFPTYEPNTTIISNGLAAMGIAVPGGIASDLAVESNVVAATGDGGFLMNGAEIDTATRLDVGFTILVFNDEDYGLISEKQIDHTGEHFGTGLTNPDFGTLAESFGISAYRPTDYGELESVLETTVPSDSISLVEIPLGQ
ncbi:MAG: acetolactate synthase large subunit [Halodesulfurarchaeum sp.]